MEIKITITPDTNQSSDIEMNFSEDLVLPNTQAFVELSEEDKGRHYAAFIVARAVQDKLQETQAQAENAAPLEVAVES
ncbi:hypothetical protein [Brumicola nitratireducens]|uniref:Uncharacterized protein n=1 Tax=Glaciecola nitratireducens (strain JCM 12485 / KCTC 12276 / FR1064) TaxID=1085623 RepID=G4QGX0_GLANF|nr:hypothetical protein [Glaciecola nitratireducens]AEP29915.1 hypothetical protein GNIT_1805 [Glaciecola nitratireducens FR1064]